MSRRRHSVDQVIGKLRQADVELGDLPPDLVPLRRREFRVSGNSVFWGMKRSGILQNTVGRERGRGLVAESTMW
jgi:hypothetical protein